MGKNLLGIVYVCGVAMAAMLLQGCVVWSLFPFHEKTAEVSPPGVNGRWVEDGDKTENTPDTAEWLFKDDKIMIRSSSGAPWVVSAKFFKIGERLFIDSTAEDVNDKAVNGWWMSHRLPCHILSKVEIDGDSMSIIPLSYDWMSKMVSSGKCALSHVKNIEADSPAERDAPILFTCSAADWTKFLTENATAPAAFPEKSKISLKRVKNN